MPQDYGVSETSNAFVAFVGAHPAIQVPGVLAQTGSEQELKAGTVLAKLTSGGKLVVLDPSGTGGADTASCILQHDVVVAAAADEPCTRYVHGDFLDAGLTWPDSITDQQKADAVADLAAAGCYVK